CNLYITFLLLTKQFISAKILLKFRLVFTQNATRRLMLGRLGFGRIHVLFTLLVIIVRDHEGTRVDLPQSFKSYGDHNEKPCTTDRQVGSSYTRNMVQKV